MNHRGVVEKWTDFILLVVGAVIFFFLVGFFLAGSITEQNEQTIRNTDRAVKAYNTLMENRIQFDKGGVIDQVELRRQLNDIQRLGYVSSPEPQEVPGGLAET